MLILVTHCDGNGSVENFLYTYFFLTAAFHVSGSHLFSYRSPLIRCDGCKALRTEELNAAWLVPKIGFEPEKNDRRSRTEVKDFRVPLQSP